MFDLFGGIMLTHRLQCFEKVVKHRLQNGCTEKCSCCESKKERDQVQCAQAVEMEEGGFHFRFANPESSVGNAQQQPPSADTATLFEWREVNLVAL